MKSENAGTEGRHRLTILAVGALLLLSLLFVGSIQADEGVPEDGTSGRAVAVNASFDGAIDLVEETVTEFEINLSGPEGIFEVDTDPQWFDYNYTFNSSLTAEPGDLVYTDDYITATIDVVSDPMVLTVTLDTDEVIDAPDDVMLTIYANNTINATGVPTYNTTSQDLTISVAAVNDMPTIDDLADFDATQGTEIKTLLNGTDEEDDFTTFDFTMTNETGGDLPDSFEIVQAEDDTWWLVINATNDDAIAAEYIVNVTVEDGDSATDYDWVTVTIVDVNDAPTVVDLVAAQDVTEDVPTEIMVEVDDIDLLVPRTTAEALTYSAKLIVGGDVANATDLPAESVYEHVDDTTGTVYGVVNLTTDDTHVYMDSEMGLSVELTVTDAGGLHAMTTFELNVINVNDMPEYPVAMGTVNTTWVESYDVAQDAAMMIGFFAVDDDADEDLTWTYTITAWPGLREADYVYTEEAMNDTSAMPETAMAGDLEYAYFDDYGAFTTVSWTTWEFAPVNDDVGTLNLTVTVEDAEWEVWTNITINITNVNDAPTAPSINLPTGATGTGVEGDELEITDESLEVNLTAELATDIDMLVVDDETLTYTALWGDGGSMEITPNEEGKLPLMHSYVDEGIYMINLTVEDGGGLEAWDVIYVNVTTGIVHEDITYAVTNVSVTTVSVGDEVIISGTYDDDGLGEENFAITVRVVNENLTDVQTYTATLNDDGTWTVTFNFPEGGRGMLIEGQEGTATAQPPTAGYELVTGVPVAITPGGGDGAEPEDEDEGNMMMILIIIIVVVIAAVGGAVGAVAASAAKKKRIAEEERKKKEEEAAEAVGPAMERAVNLQGLAAQNMLDLSSMQPQFDDAQAKQTEGNNIEAVEVITTYNTQIEEALTAQGVDVEGQLAALAAQQAAEGGELPPDQAAAAGAEGALPPDQAGGELPADQAAQLPPDQAAALPPDAGAAPDQAAAAAPDQAAAQTAPCPFCQQPIAVGTPQCAACGNAIQWG